MKTLRTLFLVVASFLATRASLAANVVVYVGPPDQSLYGRIQKTPGVFVAFALHESTGGAKGEYYLTEFEVVTAGLTSASTGNGYLLRIHAGATPSTSAQDPLVGYDAAFGWTGSAVANSAAGNPWATVVAGNTTSGTFGEALVNMTTALNTAMEAIPALEIKPAVTRTWVMRRYPEPSLLVGSPKTIPKKAVEAAKFYADVTSLLGTNELVGDVADIAIAVGAGVTVTPGSIAKHAGIIEFELAGGTAGQATTVTVSFTTATGRPLACDGPLAVLP